MYSRLKKIPSVKGTIALHSERVILICLILIAMSYAVFGQALFTSEDLNLKAGPPVGGDFVAFWSASRAMFDGMGAEIYQPNVFEAYLMENAMPRERFGLTWQYPPTYYFFIAPLNFIDFLPAYALWSFGALAIFLYILKRLFNLSPLPLLIIFSAPVIFNTVITGQNGFLTASLLALAACLPDRRPLIAGVAAGLLTVKPQLGLLLPIAYMAAGCWRAFFTAAFTTCALIIASLLSFGPEAWEAFIHSVINVGGGVKDSVYPIHKMPTVFAALHKTGVPSSIAMSLQFISLGIAMGLVGFVWRKVEDWDLRAAVLCASVFLCSPYAYYYEMTVLVIPFLVMVRRAMATQWLQGEEIGLALIWLAPLFLPGVSSFSGAQLGLCAVLGLLFSSLRRVTYHTQLPPWISFLSKRQAQA